MVMSSRQGGGGTLRHRAVYYHGLRQYLSAVLPFVQDGLARGEPVLVTVPGAAADLLTGRLGPDASGVTTGDIVEMGRNPARIISAIWDFVDLHRGRPVRVLSEPLWASRSAAETREAVRHEALVNTALAACAVSVLCPYDTSQLGRAVTASARRTHPVVRALDGDHDSPDYCAGRIPAAFSRALSPIPARARQLSYRSDLRPVRALVAERARAYGLHPDRIADLVLAVGEIAANTLRHTAGDGALHLWRGRGEIVCQIMDQGQLTDPLAGRRRPASATGLGLWVVHQVCDLVEIRSGRRGTTVRMHMRLGPAARLAAAGQD